MLVLTRLFIVISVRFQFHLFPLTPFQGIPISFKSFFMTSSHPNLVQFAFRLALDGWLKKKIFGNMSSAERALAISTFLSLSNSSW